VAVLSSTARVEEIYLSCVLTAPRSCCREVKHSFAGTLAFQEMKGGIVNWLLLTLTLTLNLRPVMAAGDLGQGARRAKARDNLASCRLPTRRSLRSAPQ
jgi:hypothetical protein